MNGDQLRYRWLDLLPGRLVEPVIVHVHGELIPRGNSVLIVRDSLLAGASPSHGDLSWPEAELCRPLCEAIASSGVAHYCKDDPELTDIVLEFFIQSIEEAHNIHDRAFVAFLTLARQEEEESGCAGCPGGAPGEGSRKKRKVSLRFDAQEMEKLRQDAFKISQQLLAARGREWGERVKVFASFEQLFEQLATAVHLPPGSCRGMLRSLPRDDLLRLRQLLDDLPALSEVIRQLGRMQPSDDPEAPSVLEQLGRIVRRTSEVVHHDVIAHRGVEVRGIERSGDIERMLPSEAVLLLNPTLRLLWQARVAERGLLTYHAPGVHTRRIQEQQSFEDGVQMQQQRADRGPIIVLLDSSGSMGGSAGTAAKALMVQIAGVAFGEKRPCYLYNFSGDGDVFEAQLSFEGEGLSNMLGAIGASFDGGTSIDEPLRRACRRVMEPGWSQADIVVLSDGYFYPDQPSIQAVKRARNGSSVRFHGINFGAVTSLDGFRLLGFDRILQLQELVGGSLKISCRQV